MDISIKVRSLISRFEQLSTEFTHQATKIEPKTPITPKTPNKSISKFFGETSAPLVVPTHKTNLTKLTDIDGEIRQLRILINSVESNDDMIKALLLLVNLLINLECIDVDGNNNVKNKKIACFKEIQGLKDRLLQTSGIEVQKETPVQEMQANLEITPTKEEHFKSTSFKATPSLKEGFKSSSEELVSFEDSIETSPENGLKPKASYVDDTNLTTLTDTIGFKSVSQIKTLFESNGDLSKSTTSLNVNNEELRLERNAFGKSDGDIRRSFETARFKPLQEMKNIFDNENNSSEIHHVDRNSTSSTISDAETVIAKAPTTNDLEDIEYEIPTENGVIENNHTEEINNSINALHVEISYYTEMVENLKPLEDAVRTEVLQENITDLIEELEKLETCGDAVLEFKKGEAFAAIGSLKKKLREKIDNSNNELKFNNLCTEVKNYDNLVSSVDGLDKVQCQALDEDIKSALAEINLLAIPAELGPRKLTTIKNLVTTQKELESKMLTVDSSLKEDVREREIVSPTRDSFDELYELNRDEESLNARIFDATGVMDDIWVEIDLVADLLDGKEEVVGVEIERTEARLKDIQLELDNCETYGDDGLEKRKSDGLEAVRIMQRALHDLPKQSVSS